MTEEQVRTYLLLGVKLKRERWEGYIYQEGGTLYKYNPESKLKYNTNLYIWTTPLNEEKWGEWEVVNE